MKYEIKIKEAGDLISFNEFLKETRPALNNAKGVILTTKEDFVYAKKYIKDLAEQEKAILEGKNVLIQLAGIKVFDDEHKERQEIRCDYNRQVETAKKKAKQEAIDLFIDEVQKLLDKSLASDTFKAPINAYQIAHEALKGKSKKLSEVLDVELKIIASKLDANATETAEKQALISEYDADLVIDKEHLLSLPIEAIKPELENRKLLQEQKIKKAVEVAEQKAVEVAKSKEPVKEPVKAKTPTGKVHQCTIRFTTDDLTKATEVKEFANSKVTNVTVSIN